MFGRFRCVREPVLVLGAYLLLVLVLHLPVLPMLGEETLGFNSADKYCHLWDFWWGWRSFATLDTSFFFSDHISYPPGMSIWAGNSGFLLTWFTIPIRWLTEDPEMTYNLTVLLSMWMSCVGGYWLVKGLWGRRGAAFCAGAILAVNPLVSYQINLGFIEYVNLGFAAAFILSTIRLVETGRTRWAVASCLWFYLSMSWCWYMGLLLLLFSVFWFASHLGTVWALARRWSSGRNLLLWAVGLLLFILPVSNQIRNPELSAEKATREKAFFQSREDIERVTINPLALDMLSVTDSEGAECYERPFPFMWVEVKLVHSLDPASIVVPASDPLRFWYYLFFISWLCPLLLAAVALRDLRQPTIRAMTVGAGLFVLLSLGPCFIFAHEVYLGTCPWMPYSLLSIAIPGIDRVQFPTRFLFGSLFALSVLSGYGLTRLARLRWMRPARMVVLYLVVIAAVANSYLDLNCYHVPMERIEVPRFYHSLGHEDGAGAVIEVPLSRNLDFVQRSIPNPSIYAYQTIHNRRRLGAHIPGFLVARQYPEEIRSNPVLNALDEWGVRHPGGDGDQPQPTPAKGMDRGEIDAGLESLRAVGFRYIIVHRKDMLPSGYREVRTLLDGALGAPQRDSSTRDILDIYYL